MFNSWPGNLIVIPTQPSLLAATRFAPSQEHVTCLQDYPGPNLKSTAEILASENVGLNDATVMTCLIIHWLIHGYYTVDMVTNVMSRGVEIITVSTRHDARRIVTLYLNSESLNPLSLQLSCFTGRSGNYSRTLTFKQN